MGEGEEQSLHLNVNSGLGVLRDCSDSKMVRYFSELPTAARQVAMSKEVLVLSKTNTRSTVHRHSYTDYIGVKIFDS